MNNSVLFDTHTELISINVISNTKNWILLIKV